MELFTVEEVADMLKCDVETVRRWLREGQLQGVKLGRAWRVQKKDLDQFIKEREV